MRRSNRWKAKQRNADSVWEADLRDGVLKDCAYHTATVFYSVPHVYTPDFTVRSRSVYIEAKGRFMDTQEASKYKWIRDALPHGSELVFLFYNPNTPMPGAKRRKDNTKQTHAEWATKNGFRWFTEETIKELL